MNRALARRILLERIYEKMTPEDKRLFVLLTMQNKSADEILGELKKNQQQLEHIVSHIDRNKWYVTFGSDVAANVLTTSAFWLLGKLLSRR